MKLYEFEGKELFKKSGIQVPKSILVGDPIDLPKDFLVVKAQLLSGKRGKSGAVKICKNQSEAEEAVKNLLGKKVNNEEVKKVLLEEILEIKKEYYLSITYDTRTRSPVIIACAEGGIDIEDPKQSNKVLITPVDLSEEFTLQKANEIAKKAGLPEKAGEVIVSLYKCFLENDCRIAEINPLVETSKGLIAADSKIVLDDDGLFRHQFTFPPRTAAGKQLTKIEEEARQIDKEDHRGSAGSSFIEFEGDIAVLASGGGASITCMDALIGYGGKPANYVEYSGNPPKAKVKRLTEVTLSKPNLKGLWIVGGRANFTDIYDTFEGIAEALVELKPTYPIVVRRAGPRDKEAFEMMKKFGEKYKWNIKLFGDETPMTETAKIMIEEIKKARLSFSEKESLPYSKKNTLQIK